MQMPPLTALRAFEAASRHGSLSAAARELNVTHAAIAQQVKKLEEWFGQKLMTREGRGVAATERGIALAASLTDGFAIMQNAVASLTQDDATRPLKITLTPTFAAHWLMPRLGCFRTSNPEVEIMLNPTAQPIDLVADDYDLAFRFGAGVWAGLESERMLESRHSVVASPALLEGKKIDTPDDLAKLPWVQELGMDERRVWLEAHGVEDTGPRNILHMPGNLVVDAVRRGEGVGITGRAWFEDDIAAGRIVTLFDEEQDEELGYWMVSRPGPHRPPLKAFMRWVREQKSL